MSFKEIEAKWQKKWQVAGAFKADDSSDKKYYVLEMFPYPSASGLHMGHALNYTIGDIFARFKRMTGWSVLYPMGFDALGLPAENAAIQAGAHPKEFTLKAIKNYIRQMNEIGLSYDWNRTLETCIPNYYKWNQFFFLKFLENDLAYRKKAPVNWCSKCNTVLANEQVHNGKCWRHNDTEVEIKQLEQWFIKTTKYAEEILQFTDRLDWPERIKIMQKNWIGKSFGTEIDFDINGETWPVFTTRPDTIHGVTFMVISAQHSRLEELTTPEQKEEVSKFLKKLKSVSEKEMEEMEKEGVFTGSYATNPITNEKVPIYAGNFVLAEYGTGMVMAVPAHDQRDFEFAKKYNIPIKIVIQPNSFELNPEKMTRAFVDDGTLVNSGDFDGENNRDAINSITKYLEENNKGKKTIQYKLRDWLVSRQRYWGTPIPIIYCDDCGAVPVPEKDLPVILPEEVTFGKGNPLTTNEDFVEVNCPKCNKKARRETDTMDTFFDSSWYFLRYADNKNSKVPFDKNKVDSWMPVDKYIGGAEHACMHLIYARFFTKALRDLGFINIDEPFTSLFNQGMLLGPDGEKMSKSKGNVITPDSVSEKYGIDTARLFLVSVANPEKDIQWSEEGIVGSLKLINKIISYVAEYKPGETSKLVKSKLHRTIKDVTKDIENFRYNSAVIKIRSLFQSFEETMAKEDLESFIKLLSPFCPHICEELWEKLGNKNFICLSTWPEYDEKFIDEEAEASQEIVETIRSDILKVLELAKITQAKEINIIISPNWKYDLLKQVKDLLKTTRNGGEIIKSVMATPLKQYGKDITKLIPSLVKDSSKIPIYLLGQNKEEQAIKQAEKILEQDFKAKVIITKAQDSNHPKARQAFPGKPAIVVE